MVPKNPLTDAAETDRQDRELVARAQQGIREALEQLIGRHQPWIYNIALRMLFQRSAGFRVGVAIVHRQQECALNIGARMMRMSSHLSIPVLLAAPIGCAEAREAFRPETIIALEQGALDRWGKGDPDGYFEIMAPDVSYFDPTTERRVDGKEQLRAMVQPFRGKISIDRAELLNPTVLRSGDLAILSFNLISHGGSFDKGPKADVRWNCTEVYRLIDGRWTITHTHWSFTKPQIVPPVA